MVYQLSILLPSSFVFSGAACVLTSVDLLEQCFTRVPRRSEGTSGRRVKDDDITVAPPDLQALESIAKDRNISKVLWFRRNSIPNTPQSTRPLPKNQIRCRWPAGSSAATASH
uniref:Putative secreted protein n=1 Tax=Anopheles triannulatus TaxID=58253 RepID=A0A2M4B5F2_9DIPT